MKQNFQNKQNYENKMNLSTIVDGFDEEAKAQKQWELLKVLGDSEFENALYLDNEGLEPLCPYCKKEVDVIEDIEVPDDAVGQKKSGLYVTQIFRKCQHCCNIYIEEVGEEPDYD